MSLASTEAPAFLIVGGPNGSGKSSAYQDTDIEANGRSVWIINPDLLTARIRAVESLELREANRAAVERIEAWLDASIDVHKTVGVETVLSTSKYEEVREHLAVRSDLIDRATRDQMAAALRYASRYLHDVFEDHERGRLRRARGKVFLDHGAPALSDFLLRDASPADLKALREHLRSDGPLNPRFKAVSELEAALRDADQPRRYGAIMTESFRLCVLALRNELSTAMRRGPHQTTR